MEFSRLIKYKMRNIFLEELYTKCGVEASPSPFYKKSNLSTSLDQHYELLLSFFLQYVQSDVNSIQLGGITTFCLLRYFRHGTLTKNHARKIVTFQKHSELFQVFMYLFLFQAVLIFPIYMLFEKIVCLETSLIYGYQHILSPKRF